MSHVSQKLRPHCGAYSLMLELPLELLLEPLFEGNLRRWQEQGNSIRPFCRNLVEQPAQLIRSKGLIEESVGAKGIRALDFLHLGMA